MSKLVVEAYNNKNYALDRENVEAAMDGLSQECVGVITRHAAPHIQLDHATVYCYQLSHTCHILTRIQHRHTR